MLQVCINDDGGIACGVIESGKHGVFLAEIAAEIEVAEAWIALMQLRHDFERAVAAAVIYHQDLPVVIVQRFGLGILGRVSRHQTIH